MDDKDLLSAYLVAYKSARTEIIERIKQRDSLYSYYLLAVGGLAGIRAIGFAIESYNKDTLVSYFDIPLAPLTIYPFLAVFFCTILCQHQIQIGKLGYLCDISLSKGKIKNIMKQDFLNWETELINYELGTLHFFKFAHYLLFIVPSALACLAQTCLLYFSYIPKWHGLSTANTSPVLATQQWLSILSVSVLNIMAWFFLFVTIYTLKNTDKDRNKLEDVRKTIAQNPSTDIKKLESAVFIPHKNLYRNSPVAFATIIVVILTVFANYILMNEKPYFVTLQPTPVLQKAP